MAKVVETILGMLVQVWTGVRQFAAECLGIRTWEDLRLQIHVLSPYAVTAMVTWNIASEDKAKLIVGLVLAVASPALAFFNTRDGFRRLVYGLLPPLQAFIVGFGWAQDSTLTPLMAAIVALLGGAMAAANTPSSRGPKDTRTAAVP
ncbi:holin [Mycobacterium phage BarrelRoll]|uniref:Holin n=3 Tax=Anayavirus TaxID=2946797 RepID=G1BPN6_9CAUD|nr:holin [Mycobacterium phage BarrelRoll]YP_009952272.1 holin [Mycobacterium phage Adephagia]AOQ29090.1 holin [Mycobacterium phage HedwigODU]ASR87545.1 holin [Mycobacterium phage Slimphazie]ASR87641.1 holin [Mycobacterium phage Tachez]AVR76243.1 holin [Mycobacterium phage ActinUp]AXH50001.1 holin [Mycobacterium phage Homura]QFG11989.1 holin [Mycobacterium phage Veliki]QFG14488.1 holin [Mycobacterium phage Atiba]QFG14585.1 holin [Mycobacterium phage Rapunzel97]